MILNNSEFKLKPSKNGILVSINNSKKPFLLKKNKYYLEIAKLIEVLKVEGYWNEKGNMAISNKTRELIVEFEKLFNNLNIHFSKHINIKVKLGNGIKKEDITVTANNERKKFYLSKNGFTDEFDRISFNISCKNQIIKITSKDKSLILDFCNEELTGSKNAKRYFVLKASNKAFTTFLNKILLEKNSTHKLRINPFLKKAKPKIIIKVFEKVIDCEGSIRFSGLTRNINLRQSSKEYIEDWHKLLKKSGINSHIVKRGKLWQLTITCNQNFKKLKNLGFILHHPIKKERFELILNSYKKHQVERNSALEHYKKLIKKNPKITISELSKITLKSKRVVAHYLLKLYKTNKIKRIKINKREYIYY